MNASFVFFALFAFGACVTYPDIVLQLLAAWTVVVIIRLIY